MTISTIFVSLPFIVLGFRALIFVGKCLDKLNPPPKGTPYWEKPEWNAPQPLAKTERQRPDHPSGGELLGSDHSSGNPQKVITVVGRTSAGKSSLANALLGQEAFATGVEHGTTSEVMATPFRAGYLLYDTPGLLDGETYSRAVLDTAKDSELVIFLTTGQLYRQELDFLRDLCTLQAAWNRTRHSRPARSTLVFLNACDLKERTMPSVERSHEITALKAQVSPWLAAETVLTGAAAPLDGGPPWIASLEGYLAHFFQQAAAA